jgi:intron-binding protein aquarius
VGGIRKLWLSVDAAQYLKDSEVGLDIYESFNLLLRRDSRENNFKAVLETIRELTCTASIGRAIPSWLQDVFLGYGDPAAASFQ